MTRQKIEKRAEGFMGDLIASDSKNVIDSPPQSTEQLLTRIADASLVAAKIFEDRADKFAELHSLEDSAPPRRVKEKRTRTEKSDD